MVVRPRHTLLLEGSKRVLALPGSPALSTSHLPAFSEKSLVALRRPELPSSPPNVEIRCEFTAVVKLDLPVISTPHGVNELPHWLGRDPTVARTLPSAGRLDLTELWVLRHLSHSLLGLQFLTPGPPSL